MKTILNLLPPASKAELRTGFVFAYVQTMLVLTLIVAAFMSGTFFAVRQMLTGIRDDLAARATASTEADAVLADITAINGYAKEVDTLQSRFVPWSRILDRIGRLIPPGVSLEQLRVTAGSKISLSGTAAHREDVLLLQKRLEDDKLFSSVASPLSNILQQQNAHFAFDLTLAPDAVTSVSAAAAVPAP